MTKIWDIPGGVHPPENKTQSNHSPIGSIALPSELIIPLNQHIGAEAMPIVNVGDAVKKGQCIAEAQGVVSSPVHASTSGHVTAIEERAISHPSGLSAQCIVIAPDGNDSWCELTPCDDYHALEKHALVEKIRLAGIAGMGGAGFPTAVKMHPRGNQKIDTLILNGTECEPYITADDVLMRERADDIVAGALLFAHILNEPEKLLIGIEDNKPEAIAAMRQAAAGTKIDVVSFPTKYPSGGEKQLIQILTGKEVPSGQIPAALGIVMQNVGTALAAYRAVRYGEPLISRVTTVVGEALQTQRNIDVLLGTPIAHVLAEHGFQAEECARLIIGGPMMGYAMHRSDVPVVKTTNCILVPSHTEMPAAPPAQPCIRCGLCAEACPASLLPQQLFWFAQSEDVDKLQSHNLFDCIECGACSFVCPSNIPLVQYYRASKGMIKKMEEDKLKSDRSRERFELRQARIEKAEAEKEAKRLARKQAAEEAKKKLAEQKASGEKSPAQPNPTTENSAANTSIDPAAQLKKLERAVSSASSRVERAQTQLKNAQAEGEDSRIETLRARLKQAEQKLSEAKDKLAQHQQGSTTATQGSTGDSTAARNAIKEKVTLSPRAQQEKTITTLKQRIETAEAKLAEAKTAGASTVDALQNGVEKLKAKLADAEAALNETPDDSKTPSDDASTLSAADAAIAKAQAKAAAMASMSDDEKAQAAIESLKTRLEKAKARLAKAEEEKSEHVDAFRAGVEKLEKKLSEAQA